VKLSAVYSKNVGSEFPSKVTVVQSVSELCKQSDIVHICSPPWVHAEQARKALDYGVSVLSEKPMALSGSEAEALRKIAAESDGVYGLVHNFLFTRAFERFRTAIDGPITSAHAVQYATTEFNIDRHGEEWFDRLPGGMFWDEAPHMIYLLRDLLGELSVNSANAFGYAVGPQQYSDLYTSLVSSGMRGSITMRHDQPLTEWWLLVNTPTKSVAMDIFRGIVIKMLGKSRIERFLRIPRLIVDSTLELTNAAIRYLWDRRKYPMPSAGFPQLYDRFVSAVKNGTVSPPVTASDGVSTIRTMERIASQAEF
jgi:predicted dehydrogenase